MNADGRGSRLADQPGSRMRRGLTLRQLVRWAVGSFLICAIGIYALRARAEWAQALWRERLSLISTTMFSARPIIAAIRQYEVERGVAPADLRDLIPDYLAYLPHPGLIASDRGSGDGWHYRRGPGDGIADRWVLGVNVGSEFDPRPLLNWIRFDDMLIYHPTGQYPESAYGGTLERIRDWGYYHE